MVVCGGNLDHVTGSRKAEVARCFRSRAAALLETGCNPETRQQAKYADSLVTVWGGQSAQPDLQVSVLDAGEMYNCDDLSDFDKGQIVMARQLGQSISETARLVGCSPAAVVSIHRQWSGKGRAAADAEGSLISEGGPSREQADPSAPEEAPEEPDADKEGTD